jgi:hypothetical protein
LQSPILATGYCDLICQLEAADFVLVLLQPDFLLCLEFGQLQNEDFSQCIQVSEVLAMIGCLKYGHVVDESSCVLKGR